MTPKYRKLKIVAIFLLTTLFFTTANASQSLSLSQGQLSLSGSAGIPIQFGGANRNIVSLEVAPEIGVFIFDKILLSLLGRVNGKLLDETPFSKPSGVIAWGLALQARYVFDLGWAVYPYAGLGLGFKTTNDSIVTARSSVDLPLGVLVAVHDNAAIQIAFPVEIIVSVDRLFDHVRWTPGQLSVVIFW